MRQRLAGRLTLTDLTVWGIGFAILAVAIWGTVATLRSGEYSPVDWASFFIFGLAQGSVYALIALGYTMVYGVLLTINFAHGEVFMSGTYIAYYVANAFDKSGFLDTHPIPAVLAVFAVAVIVSSIVAVLVERIGYRPLRRAPRLVPLITAIGASLFLQCSFARLFGSGMKRYPDVKAGYLGDG